MSESHILQRLNDLEQQLADITVRMDGVQTKIQDLSSINASISNTNDQMDQFVNELVRLWATVVKSFPDAILEFDGALVIPGVAGTGEIGPGNVKFPNSVIFSNVALKADQPGGMPLNRRRRSHKGG